ncbi:hypothetical protein [Streptomyces goshikiensis]|uniref:hypothetical protein n=1 Tax=Streptomyces goshikiensis TaxID=1942 RepID=UPI0036AC5D32
MRRCLAAAALREARAAARAAALPTGRLPASSAVQVSALFRPELPREVEAFAIAPARPGPDQA